MPEGEEISHILRENTCSIPTKDLYLKYINEFHNSMIKRPKKQKPK